MSATPVTIVPQGENKFIESLCQTIVPVEELLWVINHAAIDCNLKRPFLHFMLWVYMKTTGSNLVESGAADLQHDKSVVSLCTGVVGWGWSTAFSFSLTGKSGWLLACLTSQQHASVSQGRICEDNFTCWLVACLLNVPATCECISGTDLRRQFYVLVACLLA